MSELGEFPSQNVSRYHKQNIGPKTHSVMQQRESTMASFDGLAITETSRNFWHWLADSSNDSVTNFSLATECNDLLIGTWLMLLPPFPNERVQLHRLTDLICRTYSDISSVFIVLSGTRWTCWTCWTLCSTLKKLETFAMNNRRPELVILCLPWNCISKVLSR